MEAYLWDKQPNDEGLDGAPASKDNIKPPADLLKSNGIRKLVDQHSRLERHVGEGHTLGTHFERKDLDGVQGLERGDTKGEDGVKQKDERDESIACRLAASVVLGRNGANGISGNDGAQDDSRRGGQMRISGGSGLVDTFA